MNPRSFILYFLIISFWSCEDKKRHENEIVVFCASSLSPVLEKIKSKWEKGHQQKIIINAASSGILARQIENGAQADIFLSANLEWMEYLYKTISKVNLPKSQHRKRIDIASNHIVIVAPIDAQIDSMGFQELLSILLNQHGKISIGDPGHVPLGRYTKECMDYYQIYDQLSTKLIRTKDARSALRLVEMGEASFGFVYLSDARMSTKVQIAAVIPEESHRPINYQALIVIGGKSKTKEFFEFISSIETLDIWTKMGFGN